MKSKFSFGLLSLLLAGSAYSQGLYYVGSEAQESIPLKWVVGASLIYDDNVAPGNPDEEDSFAINPYVGLSFVSITPQTTLDVYARLGLIYYFDEPTTGTSDDTFSQSRLGLNVTHRFSERLRFSSRNFVAYELEPDYSYGYATSRQAGEYFYWQTDNSVGFRWTERFATYTGFSLTGADYAEVDNNDRFTWLLYNQFRYQLSPQTVLTAEYRYSQTEGDGLSSDYEDHYALIGAEHRFSPNTIGIIRAGAQFHTVADGTNNTSPYLELALNSQVNEQFSVRGFVRYGIENYDTVRFIPTPAPGLNAEYDNRATLRLGINSEYVLSQKVSLFGGVDYIPSSFEDGRQVSGPPGITVADADESLVNAFVGFSVRFTDMLTGTVSYNYTHQSSDFANQDYDRNRISVGLSAEFRFSGFRNDILI